MSLQILNKKKTPADVYQLMRKQHKVLLLLTARGGGHTELWMVTFFEIDI